MNETYCPVCGTPCVGLKGAPPPGTFATCTGCCSLLLTTGLPFAEKASELRVPPKVLSAHRQNVVAIEGAKARAARAASA